MRESTFSVMICFLRLQLDQLRIICNCVTMFICLPISLSSRAKIGNQSRPGSFVLGIKIQNIQTYLNSLVYLGSPAQLLKPMVDNPSIHFGVIRENHSLCSWLHSLI